MSRRLLLPLILLLVLSIAPAAQAQVIEEAARELTDDAVFIHPDANPGLDSAGEERLRELVSRSEVPMYMAILPQAARDEAGGSARGALVRLAKEIGGNGAIYALGVTGQPNSFVAGSDYAGGDGRIAAAAEDAIAARGPEGVGAVAVDFTERVNALSVGDSVQPSREVAPVGGAGDGGVGPGTIILIGGGALAAGAYFMTRRERRRLQDGAFAEAKENARDDLVALGDDLRSLDIDVELPNTPQRVKDDYAVALSAYERAENAWESARTSEDLEPVAMALEEGRWAMASAKARMEGREPPLRRPPCFFDPRHGPSSREVEWAPPFGAPRMVPACEADAQRVERGEDPHAREILVGGQPTPYWNAGPAYAPYAGGFFGGATAGLLPSLLVGSMLGMSVGSMFGAADAYASEGDFGGGDFGGGDFGGGDFGGGDFGGGDFGGGDF